MTLKAKETEPNMRIVVRDGSEVVYHIDRGLGGDWYLRDKAGSDIAHSQYRHDLLARIGAKH